MRITHCFKSFRGLGGVEAVLRGHWAHDKTVGLESHFVIFAEPPAPSIERVAFLNLTDHSTMAEARRKFTEAIATQKPDICIFHDPWLLKPLAGFDAAQRRVVIIHGMPREFPEMVRECAPWADAFCAISKPQFDTALRVVPELGPERIHRLSCPLFAPPDQPIHAPLTARQIIIGYSGRLARDAKRSDRIPSFVEALNQARLNYRLELLGEGDFEAELKRLFASNAQVTFHGRKSGDAYWQILRAWDFFILFSDSEGTPISILETMDQGVLPIMPAINSGADDYARQLDPQFIYPPYDFSVAAQTIQNVASRPQSEIDTFRKRARDIVSAHQPKNYFQTFASTLERVLAMPRVSRQIPQSHPWPLDSLSFRNLGALSRLRARFKF